MPSSAPSAGSLNDDGNVVRELERLMQRIRADADNAAAWRALASFVAEKMAQPDTAMALTTTLRTAVAATADDAVALYALGLVEISRGAIAAAHDLVARAAAADAHSAEPELLLARLHEKAGDDVSAAKHYAAALRRQPAQPRALMALGAALHRQARHREAIDAFQRVTSLRPMAAEGWGNLAVALAASGDDAGALRPAQRAAELAPASATVQSNLGDALAANGRFAAAADAYRRADELEPDNPATLNKLACAQRTFGQLDGPEQLLRRALALKPDFDLALINLGALAAIRRDFAAASSLLERAGALAGSTDRNRDDAAVARMISAEHERLLPGLLRAVDGDDPGALEGAVRQTRADALSVDSDFLYQLEELARGLGACEAIELPRLATTPAFWPALEAHFSRNRGDDVDGIARDIAWLQASGPVPAGLDARDGEDLVRFARAVRRRATLTALEPAADAAMFESRLRESHAALTWHRLECLPGQFKMLANVTAFTPFHRLVPPRAVAGSLRRFFDDIYPGVAPGLGRAILVRRAIGGCHPFIDGNGRAARFWFNAELERAGLRPIVVSQRLAPVYRDAVIAARQTRKPTELIAFAAQASAETTSIIERLDR